MKGREGVGDGGERVGNGRRERGGRVWNGFGRTVGSCVGIETKLH